MTPPVAQGPSNDVKTRGGENLEVMQDARRYNAFLLKLVEGNAGGAKRVLDFGAGIGTVAIPLTKRAFEVECLEPHKQFRRQLSGRGVRVYESLEQIQDATFPYVYTLNVLEHIEDDAKAVRELSEKLIDGGRLLIYVPAFESLYSEMDRRVGHYRRYTARSLRRVVEQAGLDVVLCRYVDVMGIAATMAYKCAGSANGGVGRRSLLLYDRLVFPASRVLDRLGFERVAGKNVYLVAVKSRR